MSKEKDLFKELKERVREEGLLERVPIRGSIEMIAIVISMILIFATANLWNPILLGLFMTLVFTRAVFVSHDILHTQYFKNKTLSRRLSYPFSATILSSSTSWWDFKHNINHHTYCNIAEKDEDIRAFRGAFTTNNKKDIKLLRKFKYLIFWGSTLFMYPAFIVQSYNFAIKNKKYGELAIMSTHWFVIWGTMFYILPFYSALVVMITLYFSLSLWLSFGFMTNHLGCEDFSLEEGNSLSWMELQMRGSRSLIGGKFVHWFFGGLNTQIEHHLFPKAPRFNLLKVQNMTRAFAKENNLVYFETTPLQAYVQINNVIKRY